MKSRVLKVEELSRKTVIPSKKSRYPLIRLKGNWMRAAGILPGMVVKVEVSENQIVIKL